MKNPKIVSIGEAARIARVARKAGKTVVSTNGCFDLLHIGHTRNLKTARQLGDLLILGINSDASVRKNKSDLRPIMPQQERAEMLAEYPFIDYVFVFSGKSPIPWIKEVRPSIHVKGKGSERSPAFAPEKEAVEKGGGRMYLAPLVKGRSTTNIIERIVSRYKK